MNLRRRPIVIVLGMMTMIPVAGVIWQTVQYLVGLRRLGFDVYYAEDHGGHPSMLTDEDDPWGTTKAAELLERTLAAFDFRDRWSYHAWHTGDYGSYFGIGETAINHAFRNAAAVLNLHGGTQLPTEHRWSGALIYVETDPVAPQIELHNGLAATAEFLDAHTAHFTFGENLGAPDCKVPAPPDRYRFYPTRQPIVFDFWQSESAAGDLFTTIANWRQTERPMTLDEEVYHWSKHFEFMKFLDLPRRTEQQFELALSSYTAADQQLLEEQGWRVRSALGFSRDPDRYRDYIAQSRGEWTVAKDQNVRLRSGWFSDRAASYLASGRPVITQETAFSNLLPTGRGLFAFSTMEEILAAISEINSDYESQSRAAADIAREYFDAENVLAKMMQQAGVSLPREADRRFQS